MELQLKQLAHMQRLQEMQNIQQAQQMSQMLQMHQLQQMQQMQQMEQMRQMNSNTTAPSTLRQAEYKARCATLIQAVWRGSREKRRYGSALASYQDYLTGLVGFVHGSTSACPCSLDLTETAKASENAIHIQRLVRGHFGRLECINMLEEMGMLSVLDNESLEFTMDESDLAFDGGEKDDNDAV